MNTPTFRPSLSLLLAGLTLHALASSSSGAILAYDGFVAGDSNAEGEYVPGAGDDFDINGQNPVLTGFSGAWSGGDSWDMAGTPPIATLSYSDGTNSLLTTGNAVRRKFTGGSNSRALDVANLSVSGTTTYFSFLMKLDDPSAWGRVEFAESSTSDRGGLAITADGTNFYSSAGYADTTLAAVDTNTHLFVFKVVFGASDSWSVWMDPTDLTTETTADFSGTVTGTASLDLSHLVFFRQLGGTVGNGLLVDEIRIGTSWADVTPVPEPSTFALYAGMVALAGLMLRRKRLAGRI